MDLYAGSHRPACGVRDPVIVGVAVVAEEALAMMAALVVAATNLQEVAKVVVVGGVSPGRLRAAAQGTPTSPPAGSAAGHLEQDARRHRA